MAGVSILTESLLLWKRSIYSLTKALQLKLISEFSQTPIGKAIWLQNQQFLSFGVDKWIRLWKINEQESNVKNIGNYKAKKKVTDLTLLRIKDEKFAVFGDKFGDIYSLHINSGIRGVALDMKDEIVEVEQAASQKEFDTKAPEKFLAGHMDTISQLHFTPDRRYLCSIDRMNKLKISRFPKLHNLVQVILPFTKRYQARLWPLPNNNLLTYSQAQSSIKIYQAATGKEISSLKTHASIDSKLYPIFGTQNLRFALDCQEGIFIYELKAAGELQLLYSKKSQVKQGSGYQEVKVQPKKEKQEMKQEKKQNNDEDGSEEEKKSNDGEVQVEEEEGGRVIFAINGEQICLEEEGGALKIRKLRTSSN